MNTALWQATWGYFLTNMIGMDGTGLTPETLAWVREHFITHVRSAGPFPPLRCGKQPYGVLPVTSLDMWQPRADEDAASTPRQVAQDVPRQPARQRLASAARRRRAARPSHRSAESGRGSRGCHAYRWDLARLQRTLALRASLPGAPARVHRAEPRSGRLHSDPGRAHRRHPAAPRIPVAFAALTRYVCRRDMARVGAAHSRRRGIALAQARAELHRRSARGFHHRCAGGQSARGGHESPAGIAAPLDAAGVRECDCGHRGHGGWRELCGAAARSRTDRPRQRRAAQHDVETPARIARSPESPGTKTIREHLDSSARRSMRLRSPRSAHFETASLICRTSTAKRCST